MGVKSVIIFMGIMAFSLFFIFLAEILNLKIARKVNSDPYKIETDRKFKFLFTLLISFLLLLSSLGLLYGWNTALFTSLVSLVGVVYYSLKTMSWDFKKNFTSFIDIIRIAGFIGSSVSIIILIMVFQ